MAHAITRLIAIVCITLVAMPAAAKPKPKTTQTKEDNISMAERLTVQAKQLYEAQRYEEAARLFMQAFALSQVPILVFNAARCFENAKMWEQALAHFDIYLRLNNIKPEDRHVATMRMEDIRRQQEQQKKMPTVPSEEIDEPVPATPSNEMMMPVPATPTAAEVDLVGWSSLGGGAALVLTGATLAIIGNSKITDANAMDFSVKQAAKVYQNEVDSGKTLRTIGFVTTSVGMVATGFGIYRLLTHKKSPDKITWTVGPNSIMLSARF